MERVFIKEIGRFKKNDIRDYSKPTWDQIALSAGMNLNVFTKPVEKIAQGKQTKH